MKIVRVDGRVEEETEAEKERRLRFDEQAKKQREDFLKYAEDRRISNAALGCETCGGTGFYWVPAPGLSEKVRCHCGRGDSRCGACGK